MKGFHYAVGDTGLLSKKRILPNRHAFIGCLRVCVVSVYKTVICREKLLDWPKVENLDRHDRTYIKIGYGIMGGIYMNIGHKLEGNTELNGKYVILQNRNSFQ
jgi:hypothetical protein